MTKTKKTKIPDESRQPVDVAWLAEEICEVTPRRLQQILQERGTPRAGHGKVRLSDGLHAFLRHTEEALARQRVSKMVDDPALQRVFEKALIRHWRGLD